MKTEFETNDAYLEDNIPTFLITSAPNLKEKIGNIRSQLKPRGLDIVVSQSKKDLKLSVFVVKALESPSRRIFGFSYPLVLFIATTISVTISGYITVTNYLSMLRVLEVEVDELSFLWSQTALYTLSVMSIVGLHELGHIIACRMNHIDVSLPLFIPGIPGITIGTFGAVIRQKSPAQNRDQLFDIGFSGPVVGFIIALIVSVFGYFMSLPVTRAEYGLIVSKFGPAQSFSLPLIFRLLGPYLIPSPNSYTHFLHPLAEAGWMGTLLTFLNAFPIGQFDGGHVARAVLGSKYHRILSYTMTVVMFLAGWWTMALLAILLVRFDHPGTLDDVSPLSKKKKMLALLFVMIFLACFTVSPDNLLAPFLE